MRIYCKSDVFKYFREYIESILLENDKIILYEENENIEILDDNISNVFISYIPNIKFNNTNNNTINLFYLNTEQLTRDDMKHFVKNNIKLLLEISKENKNIKLGVLDYSIQNIYFLKNIDNYNIESYHIPYQYNEKEIIKLKKMINNAKKNSDFSFSGTLSYYRNNIVSQITNKNMSVNIIDGWYNERDLKIGKSKVLLNIHYNENYNIYESIRCDRWIFAGHLVLTEKSHDNDSIDVKDFLITSDYVDLPNKANNIIKNLNFYKNKYFSPEKLILLQKVIDERKKTYFTFRNLYN